MKILYYLCLIFIIGVLISLYSSYNLDISYKYEVDLAETNLKIDNTLSKKQKNYLLRNILLREIEIAEQRKSNTALLYVFMIGFMNTLLIIIINFFKTMRK